MEYPPTKPLKAGPPALATPAPPSATNRFLKFTCSQIYRINITQNHIIASALPLLRKRIHLPISSCFSAASTMDSTEQPPSTNPVEPSEPLQKPASDTITNEAHPPQPPLPNDSAVTKAEKVERNGADASNSSVKRPREPDDDFPSSEPPRKRGVAPIKSE